MRKKGSINPLFIDSTQIPNTKKENEGSWEPDIGIVPAPSPEPMEKASTVMDIKVIAAAIEEKLLEAAQRRFTGEIRLTFNVSQGGFSTTYFEKERETLIRKK